MSPYDRKVLTALLVLFVVLASLNIYFHRKYQVHLQVVTAERSP